MAGRGTDEGRRKLPGSGRAQPSRPRPEVTAPGTEKPRWSAEWRAPSARGCPRRKAWRPKGCAVRRSVPSLVARGKRKAPQSGGGLRRTRRRQEYGRWCLSWREPGKPGTRLRWLREIFVDDIPINRRQRAQVGDRYALVDGMHGLPEQAEFHHRAMGGDEARI